MSVLLFILLSLLFFASPSLLAMLITMVFQLDMDDCGALFIALNVIFFLFLMTRKGSSSSSSSSSHRPYDPEHNIDDFTEEYGPIDWWHESLHSDSSDNDQPRSSDRDDDWFDRDR